MLFKRQMDVDSMLCALWDKANSSIRQGSIPSVNQILRMLTLGMSTNTMAYLRECAHHSPYKLSINKYNIHSLFARMGPP